MHYKLFIPGPCEVDQETLAAMAHPIYRHYGPEWMEIYDETLSLLREVYQTEASIYMVPGTGSAALDMALGSLFDVGDTVVIGDNGFFGERLEAMGSSHGLRVVKFSAPHGTPLDPTGLREVLGQEPDVKGVAVVHHETGTTVLNPLEDLGRAAAEAGVPIIVDAISSLGGVPLPVDEWGIDVCVTVGNKCLECPPGLGLISVSPRAWELVDRRRSSTRGWYLDLRTWREYAVKWASWHPYPVTLPTNNILALRTSLQRIVGRGLEAHFARYWYAAQAVRQGLSALGFDMLVEAESASPVATAVKAHPEFEVEELITYLAESHGILVSPGLGPLKGKIFRVGHMGKASTSSYLEEFLLAVEEFLRLREIDVVEGSSLVALPEGA